MRERRDSFTKKKGLCSYFQSVEYSLSFIVWRTLAYAQREGTFYNTEHLFPASKMRVKYKGNETAVGMMSFSPWGFVGWQRNGLVGV